MPPPLAIDELAAQIVKLTAGLNAHSYKWLMLVAEYDARCTWPNGELQSCAQWLQRNCGLKLGAARERLRVAHALRGLPKISAAMARGSLSFSKVRAASRIATRATEEQLLAVALKGSAEDVEHAAQQLRRGPDMSQGKREPKVAEEGNKQISKRCVTHSWESDGCLNLNARLPADSGKLLLHALETAMKEDPGASFTARRADALVAVANSFIIQSGRQAPDAPQLGIAGDEQPRHSAHIHHLQQARPPSVAA